jgi:hypothetical protein
MPFHVLRSRDFSGVVITVKVGLRGAYNNIRTSGVNGYDRRRGSHRLCLILTPARQPLCVRCVLLMHWMLGVIFDDLMFRRRWLRSSGGVCRNEGEDKERVAGRHLDLCLLILDDPLHLCAVAIVVRIRIHGVSGKLRQIIINTQVRKARF